MSTQVWEGLELVELANVDDSNVAVREEDEVNFVTFGNGMYLTNPAVMLPDMYGKLDLLCHLLHPDESLLAMGRADSNLRGGTPLEGYYLIQMHAVRCTCHMLHVP